MAEPARADPTEPSLDGGAPTCRCGPDCRCGVAAALRRVPWDRFCLAQTPSGTRFVASAMHDLPSPDTVATMVEALGLRADSRVLQVGTGTGYTAAVVAEAAPAGEVFTVERQPTLLEFARRRFDALGYGRIQGRLGDGLEGWLDAAPFDAILVSFPLAKDPPGALLEQLFLGGRLVAPMGRRRDEYRLVRFVRRGPREFVREELRDVRLMSKLGDVLVEMGAASREAVEKAAEAALTKGRLLGEELGRLARVDERDVYRALALQRGLDYATVDQLTERLDPGVCEAVPRNFLEHNHLLPLAREERGAARVATCDPDASPQILATAFPACRAIELVLVTPTDFRRLWRTVDLVRERAARGEAVGPVRVEADGDLLASAAEDAHYVALLDTMLLDAVADRASDVHLEQYGDRVRVRLRIDGQLRDLPRYRLSPPEMRGLVNVIKVRADLDIAERRLPQGGRIKLRVGAQGYDLRVQTQPALHGEHVVIRLLSQQTELLTIESLGFPDPIARQYRRLLESPAGLVLVVGPTGSGKSTTLYAGLQVLARDATRKVITVEDPIEYSIEDVQQCRVRPEIGFHFADAMRAFVREDPDVILVGEIRDAETALEAIRASQTGHVVLSTLHCNDATDAVQRLLDLGMHPNSIGSELLAVIAQRLARRVCESCRQPAAPDPELLGEVFPAGAPADFVGYAGRGCRRCDGVGERGRVAVIEFLRTQGPIRQAIAQRLAVDELRAAGLEHGLLTMRDAALAHVRAGTIPLSELRRILPAERMASG